MTQKKPRRRDPGEGSVHPRPNGTYCGQVDLGYDITGKRRRKTVYGKTREEVTRKVRELRRQLEEHGDLPTSDITVEKWLTYWLDSIAAKRLKPNTFRSYRTAVREHLIPTVGPRPLSRLAPQHIRAMHDTLIAPKDDGGKGLSSTTALNAHRVLSVALNDAVREGRVGRNVAALVHAPAKEASKRTGLSAADALKVLKVAGTQPLGSRWLAALLLGLRQGERLGLRWSHVDLDNGVADLSWALQRVPWVHTDGCDVSARRCPNHRLSIPRGMEHVELEDNLVLLTPKTKGSIRVVGLTEPLRLALIARQAEVEQERPNYTVDHDLIWCQKNGSPLDPRRDWQDWTDTLKAAKVGHVTLHEARHTCATLLLEAGTDPKIIQTLMGHSDMVVTQGYLHVSLALQREAVAKIGRMLALD